MAATTMVHIRLDENVKARATESLAAMGLSVSDAVRVFLTRVAAEKQLPFALKVPNARRVPQSKRPMRSSARVHAFHEGRRCVQ